MMDMKMPYIPITDPEAQLDAVLGFLRAWNGPLQIAYGEYTATLEPCLCEGQMNEGQLERA